MQQQYQDQTTNELFEVDDPDLDLIHDQVGSDQEEGDMMGEMSKHEFQDQDEQLGQQEGFDFEGQ